MESLLNKQIRRCEEIIKLAKGIHNKCKLRNKKKYSLYRAVLSFFFSRSWEMFHSFLLLVKNDRVVDASILLRSLCNMAIDSAYIVKDSKLKEVKSIKYCIEGDKMQIKIINSNLKDFRGIDSKIDLRKKQLELNLENNKNNLRRLYPNELNWKYPRNIEYRAIEAGGVILMLYNLVYRYLSTIEHHNIFFGQDYVDFKRAEPILIPEKIEKSRLFKPEFLLYMYEWIFLTILLFFNGEYRLKFKNEILRRIKIHKNAYKDLERIKENNEKDVSNEH